MFWDSHLHTSFSGDSDAPPASMVEAAKKKNLAGLTITDHEDLDFPDFEEISFELDLTSYEAAITVLQETYADQIPVCFGVELGLQPHLAERHAEILKSHAFDFVIGSSHLVHGKDPYYTEFYLGRHESEAYMEYFESILENIRAFDGFDVYGHLDYVVRYGPTTNEHYEVSDYQDVLDTILKILIEKGKGIEVNTGGLKYGLGHPNPTEDILRRYHDLGGEILTIGSDAHEPKHLGFEFEKIGPILKSCGFHHYTVFKERKPIFIKID